LLLDTADSGIPRIWRDAGGIRLPIIQGRDAGYPKNTPGGEERA